jgi:hypothetical protein
MITIFGDFLPISGEKIVVFLQNQYYDQERRFSRQILKNHDIGRLAQHNRRILTLPNFLCEAEFKGIFCLEPIEI